MAREAPPDILTPEQRGQIDEFLGSPIKYPEEFKQWLTDYLAVNVPPIPVSQLLGYKGTLARYDHLVTTETLSSPTTTWTDLGTVGPEIDKLADGVYWAAWGCYVAANGGAVTNRMGLSVNGADPSTYAESTGVSTAKNMWRATQLLVKSGTDNNTVTAKFYTDPITGTGGDFAKRWMALMRIT